MWIEILAILALAFALELTWTVLGGSSKARGRREGEGKTILITGCDSGFGKSLAYGARELGFNVVAACYTQAAAEELSKEGMVGVQADLSKQEGIEHVVTAAKKAARDHGLWALVNNAGMVQPGNVEWLDPKVYEQIMQLNFHTPVKIIYELLPLLKQSKGRVMNVSSSVEFCHLPSNSPYTASKAALAAYSDCLRSEMLPWGVKVMIIQPGTMRTPLAMAYAASWLRGFQSAPEDRQKPYGIEWAQDVAKLTTENLEFAAADPSITVDVMLDGLVSADPPTRSPTGWFAKYFLKPISWLPDKMRDSVGYFLTFGLVKRKPAGLGIVAVQ